MRGSVTNGELNSFETVNSRTVPEFTQKRMAVAQALTKLSANIRSTVITRMDASDLKLLFELYDQTFFDGYFRNHFKGTIKFSLSSRLTKSAGKTICPKNIGKLPPEKVVIEIRIGTSFFLKYNAIDTNKEVCGLPTKNALEALLLVFEHELCHLIEFITYHHSSCSNKRFQTIAFNLFGHTGRYHKLPTRQAIVQANYGLKIGDQVAFNYHNQTRYGILYRINQRATVMVPDRNGAYIDQEGKRYTKFYVPVKYLKHL